MRPSSILLIVGLLCSPAIVTGQDLGERRQVSAARFSNNGEWLLLEDGTRLWRSTVHSAGASAIRLHFQDFRAGAGTVWVHGLRASADREGPFTGEGRFADGDFWTREFPGDTAVVEYLPPSGSTTGQTPFQVTELIHVWPQPDLAAGQSGTSAAGGSRNVTSCHKDVSCYQQYQDPAKAVVFVRYLAGSIYRNCSGVILRDTSGNPGGYLLTSNRCVPDDTTAKLLQVYWKFQTTACNGGAPSPNDVPSVAGGRLIDTRKPPEGDFSLVHLESIPSVSGFAELSSNELAAGAAVYGIHHPDGSYKRVALGLRATDRDVTADGLTLPAARFYQVTWTAGQMESGSSGSPLFNDANQVVGLLGPAYAPSIGQVGCDVSKLTSTYGRMSLMAPLLKRYLDPSAAEPTILTLSPSSITAGAGEVSLLVRGMGFSAGSTVYWGETALHSTFSSAQSMRAQVDAGRIAQPGIGRISVKRPDGVQSNFVDLPVIAPSVALSSTALTVSAEVEGAMPAAQVIQVTSVPSGLAITTSIEYQEAGGWLQLTADRSATPAALTIQASPQFLSPGAYHAFVKVIASGMDRPVSLPVTLTISRTFNFLYGLGMETPKQKCFALNAAAGQEFTVTTSGEPWLEALPALGSAPSNICVGIAPAGLEVGKYAGTVSIQPSGLTLDIILQVTPPPQLSLSTEKLAFDFVPGSTLTAKKVSVKSVNPVSGLPYTWTVTPPAAAWLRVSASSEVTPSDLTISVKPEGLAPGAYSAVIAVAGKGFNNDPKQVEVSLQVQEVRLDASPSSPTLLYEAGAELLPSQSVRILAQASGGTAAKITFTAAAESEGGWLQVDLRSGTTPRDLRITAKPGTLANGEYAGSLRIESPDAANSPISIPVVLKVVGPGLVAEPAALQLEMISGNRQPIQKQIAVKRSSSGTEMGFTVAVEAGSAWLTAVAPAGAATPNSVKVAATAANLAPGAYSSAVIITSPTAGNSPLRVPVALTVRDRPQMLATPSTLAFTTQAGFRPTAALPLSISGGGAAFSITAHTTDGTSWLYLDKLSGTTPATILVSVDPSGKKVGSYGGIIRIDSPDSINATQTVLVTLEVTKSPTPLITPAAVELQGQAGSNRALSGSIQMATSGDPLYARAYVVEGGQWLTVSGLVSAAGVFPGDPLPHPGTLNYFADLRALMPGIHKGRISLVDVGTEAPLVEIPVTLTVRPATLALPYWVDGGAWTSSLTLMNTDNQPASFRLAFRDANGAPLLMNVAGLGRLSEVTDTIPVGGARSIVTEGSAASTTEGWAELTADRGVNGYSLLSQKRQNGDTEAAFPLYGNAGSHLVLPFDNTTEFTTALRLLNPTAAASALTVKLRDDTGQAIASSTLDLPAGAQWNFSLDQKFEETAGRRGTVEITSSTASVSAIGLRFSKEGAFTPLPPATLGTEPSGMTTLVIPNVVDGGSWQTSTLLWNPNPTPAPFYLKWRIRDGTSISIPLPLDASPMEYFDLIPAWGTRLVASSGLGDALLSAQAEITAPATVRAAALLQQGMDTSFYSERTIPAAQPLSPPAFVAFDNREGVSTALIISNGSSVQKLPYFLVLRDENGTILTFEGRSLAASAQEALDISSQYPVSAGRSGVIEISGGPVSVIGLRSTSGGALTVVPAVVR
ncbi:S1 family peptidase [Paludibaculum fermentans]|uniref:S1 family peptidase n=1 Tax=Paludibaculum fermentans TaxID=1473598 RepID=UPI003EBDDAB5